MATGDGTSWLKYGCLGCLGVLGILLLVILGVAGLGWQMANSQQVEEQVLTPAVPTFSRAPDEERSPGEPDEPEGSRGAERKPTGSLFLATDSAVGRVVLDLANADFYIEPARPGEPLRVEATYDRSAFRLEETIEEPEDGPWIYRLKFRRTASGLIVMLSQVMGGSRPKVRIFLPIDVPLMLDLDSSEGGTSIELGGLWLTSAEFEFEKGGFDLSFGEPLRGPMDYLSIHGAMGGFKVSSLGNASPRRLDVDFRMGGMKLDLRGRWVVDSEINISSRMGGGLVHLPDNVLIEGLDIATPRPSGEVERLLPTLSFTTSSKMGELEFR